jgi:hypothetical protein
VHLNRHIGELGHAPVRASKSPHRRISPLPLKYDTSVSRLENEFSEISFFWYVCVCICYFLKAKILLKILTKSN